MFQQATDPCVMQVLGRRRAAQQGGDLRVVEEAANQLLQKGSVKLPTKPFSLVHNSSMERLVWG